MPLIRVFLNGVELDFSKEDRLLPWPNNKYYLYKALRTKELYVTHKEPNGRVKTYTRAEIEVFVLEGKE